MKRAFRLLLLIGAAFGILILSLSPNPPEVLRAAAGFDKVQHTAAFVLLSLLFIWAIRGNDGRPRWAAAMAWTLFACAAYGALIEFLQQYTGRNPDIVDFYADLAGTVTGMIAFWWGERLSRRRTSAASDGAS